MNEKYLKQLSKQFPNRAAVSTEIVNLSAILNLPKGTEHYMTDIHGEYEQFTHVLRNGSGSVRRKIDEVFGDNLVERDKRQLATLVYYPEEKMRLILSEKDIDEEEWYNVTLHRLIKLTKKASSKYTRSKVRKALPKDFAYIMEELMSDRSEIADQEGYYGEIFREIIKIGRAKELVVAFCELIRRLTVDHLHIIGDIYDRGPAPHLVMEDLMKFKNIDIQWGNHDVVWMGAAAGNPACVATVLRICARYGNLDILEQGYGISALPLVRFAMKAYANDECQAFPIKYSTDHYDQADEKLDMKIHKAISIIQFKVEGQMIMRHPEYKMDNRMLLDKIDRKKGTVKIKGVDYKLLDPVFPTVDPKNPYELTEEEKEVMDKMQQAFINSEKLQRHVEFLYEKGSLYKLFNGQLLFHGCVPLNEDGTFMEVTLEGKTYKGKALYDKLDKMLREAYYDRDMTKPTTSDIHYYGWLNAGSPVFGKDQMATFERQYLTEKEPQAEILNPYYKLQENEEVINNILKEFGLEGDDAHIVNGHVPVKQIKGESPVRCKGKLLSIDGGFSKPYQKTTGIAGYTLTYNSYGMVLVAHQPFKSMMDAVEKETDVHSNKILEERVFKRKLVKDTDVGRQLKEDIKDLEELLDAYKKGLLPEAK